MISFMLHDEQLSIGQCATLACLLEATTPKPGNVHRGVDFEDMTFLDFAVSAAAIGPVMDRVREYGVGQTVLEAIRATRRLVPVNTNLGDGAADCSASSRATRPAVARGDHRGAEVFDSARCTVGL